MTDAELIEYTPPGFLFELALGAYLKYAVEHEPDPRQRLDMLEMIESLAHHQMPIQAIAAIEAMPALGVEIVLTAAKLDRDRDGMARCDESFAILTRQDVFSSLCRISPSILKALAIYHHRDEGTANG